MVDEQGQFFPCQKRILGLDGVRERANPAAILLVVFVRVAPKARGSVTGHRYSLAYAPAEQEDAGDERGTRAVFIRSESIRNAKIRKSLPERGFL
jgi:hypothetical protein